MAGDANGFAPPDAAPPAETRVTCGGADLLVIAPASYTGAAATGLVLYVGGNGEDREAWFSDPLKGALRDRLLADGRLLASVSAGTAHWGGDPALARYAAAYARLRAYYRLSGTVLLPQSMGGAAAFRMVRDPATFPGVRGVYAIYPVCSPLAVYDHTERFRPQILAAWGASDRAALAAALAGGRDPLTAPAAAYPDIRYRFRHSPGDAVVPKAGNTDALRALLSGRATRENSSAATTGDHGDPSNFDPEDASAFVAASLAAPTPGGAAAKK